MIRFPRWLFFVIAVLVLVFDQASKWWALNWLAPIHSIPVIPNLFSLTFVENPGVAFGLFPGYGAVISAVIIVLGISSIWFMKEIDWRRLTPNLIGGLLVGGGVGNLLDRARFGHVVDFLDWHAGAYEWPVFNIADSAICISFAWMFLLMLRAPSQSSPTAAAPARDV